MVNSWLVCICNIHVFDIRKMKALKNFSGLAIIGTSGTFLVVFLKNICFVSQFVKIGASVFGLLYFLCVDQNFADPQLHPRKGGSRCWTWRVWFPTLVHLIYRELTQAQDPNMTKRSTIKFPRCHSMCWSILIKPMLVTCINSMWSSRQSDEVGAVFWLLYQLLVNTMHPNKYTQYWSQWTCDCHKIAVDPCFILICIVLFCTLHKIVHGWDRMLGPWIGELSMICEPTEAFAVEPDLSWANVLTFALKLLWQHFNRRVFSTIFLFFFHLW